MPDPNAKLMPPNEDLPSFMASIPRVSVEEALQLGQDDFRRRVAELMKPAGEAVFDQAGKLVGEDVPAEDFWERDVAHRLREMDAAR